MPVVHVIGAILGFFIHHPPAIAFLLIAAMLLAIARPSRRWGSTMAPAVVVRCRTAAGLIGGLAMLVSAGLVFLAVGAQPATAPAAVATPAPTPTVTVTEQITQVTRITPPAPAVSLAHTAIIAAAAVAITVAVLAAAIAINYIHKPIHRVRSDDR
jgi:hypothetical protein